MAFPGNGGMPFPYLKSFQYEHGIFLKLALAITLSLY